MKYLKEYEDEEIKGMIDDLETIGQGGLVGFMWIGSVPKGSTWDF